MTLHHPLTASADDPGSDRSRPRKRPRRADQRARQDRRRRSRIRSPTHRRTVAGQMDRHQTQPQELHPGQLPRDSRAVPQAGSGASAPGGPARPPRRRAVRHDAATQPTLTRGAEIQRDAPPTDRRPRRLGQEEPRRRGGPAQEVDQATVPRPDQTGARRAQLSARQRGQEEVPDAQPGPACRTARVPRRKPLVWTAERVARWETTGKIPAPVMVWTPAQTGAFLDFASTERLYALFHLVAFRGLRRAEVAGLPWTDVDLEAGTARSGRRGRTAISTPTTRSPSTAIAPSPSTPSRSWRS
jgi:hypothetical protein